MSFSLQHHQPTINQPAAPAAPSQPQPPAQQQQQQQQVAIPVGPVGQVQQSGGLPPVPSYTQPAPVQQQQQQPAPQGDTALAAMQEQMNVLTNINQNLMRQLNTSAAVPAQQAVAAPTPEFKPFEYKHETALTNDDKKLLGGTYDAVQRLVQDTAAQMFNPLVEQINNVSQSVFEYGNKFTDIEGKFTGTQKQIYNTALMTTVPDLNQIVQSPAFNQFAGQQVPMTNKTVRDMLSEAHANQDISTINNIVSQFKTTQQQQQQYQQPNIQHNTQSTANPGLFAQPMQPVQAPPMTNYMQPNTAYQQQAAPQNQAGNQALIEQRYETAKRNLSATKTPEAKAEYDAAAADMFTMQMGVRTG